jgi:hypothetical protein
MRLLITTEGRLVRSVNMNDRRTCLVCGTQFPATREFCPVCLLRSALGKGAEFDESSSEETAKPAPQHAAHRFEHYELVIGEDGRPVELGRGAMGVTYKAFDVHLRCPVTLKVISERNLGDESARFRFLREARAAASLRHPNVATVFHLGRTCRTQSRESVSQRLDWVRGAARGASSLITQGGSPVRELRSLGSVRGRPVMGIPTAIANSDKPFHQCAAKRHFARLRALFRVRTAIVGQAVGKRRSGEHDGGFAS